MYFSQTKEGIDVQPIIGIIGNFNGTLIPEHANLPISYIGQGYLDAIKKAGGIPVIITPRTSLASISTLIERIDGLLLPGGKDVDPYFYDEEPSLKLGAIDSTLDRFEIEFLRQAYEKNLPTLGICRGLQIANVFLGGSLYQDLSDYSTLSVKHNQYQTAPWQELTHSIKVTENNLIADFFGPYARVNSFHHQALKTIAPKLSPVAYSSDGIVEAVTGEDFNFLGVQWHPETLYQDHDDSFKLFVHLICEAKKFAKKR